MNSATSILAAVMMCLCLSALRAQVPDQAPGQVAADEQAARPVIAVLPFAMLGDEPRHAWIGTAIQQNIQAEFMRRTSALVLAPQTLSPVAAVAPAPPAPQPQATQPAAPDAPGAAAPVAGADLAAAAVRATGAQVVIWGSYQVIGENVRVIAHLTEVSSAQAIGALKATAPLADFLKVEDELAEQAMVMLFGPPTDQQAEAPRTDGEAPATASQPLVTIGTEPARAAETAPGGRYAPAPVSAPSYDQVYASARYYSDDPYPLYVPVNYPVYVSPVVYYPRTYFFVSYHSFYRPYCVPCRSHSCAVHGRRDGDHRGGESRRGDPRDERPTASPPPAAPPRRDPVERREPQNTWNDPAGRPQPPRYQPVGSEPVNRPQPNLRLLQIDPPRPEPVKPGSVALRPGAGSAGAAQAASPAAPTRAVERTQPVADARRVGVVVVNPASQPSRDSGAARVDRLNPGIEAPRSTGAETVNPVARPAAGAPPARASQPQPAPGAASTPRAPQTPAPRTAESRVTRIDLGPSFGPAPAAAAAPAPRASAPTPAPAPPAASVDRFLRPLGSSPAVSAPRTAIVTAPAAPAVDLSVARPARMEAAAARQAPEREAAVSPQRLDPSVGRPAASSASSPSSRSSGARSAALDSRR